MSQPPNNNGRVRRMSQYGVRPEDIDPSKPRRVPQTKPAIGRSAELQARMAQDAGRRLPVYSDFDDVPAANRSTVPPGRKKKKNGHNLLWLSVALICLMLSGALVVFVAPQLLNLELGEMSNFAFVNGSVIIRDQAQIDQLAAARAALDTDRIHQGVYIDGIHVGGMTRQEAIDAVNAVPSSSGGAFDITVNVDGYTWSINSVDVPLYRNTQEVVQQAYAIGRSNTMGIRGTSTTPFRQRLGAVQDVAMQPVGLWTQTTYDHEVVHGICQSIAATMSRDPINASVATFDAGTKRFTFNPDENGLYVDGEAIYLDVTAWLDGGVYTGTIHVTPEIILAPVTHAELMNSFGLVSSFTTNKTGNSNRTTNIALSANAINGITVLPGETFSFNKATGQRTEAKGYKAAAAIAGGETVDEIGGGVCQTSSTLFNAVVRADLTIVSRKPHAWPSDYVPKGEDATVNWPDLDFKFRNDTDWPIFIVAWCDKSAKTVTVEIYGMTRSDGVTIDLESEVTYTKNPPDETLYVYNPDLEYGTEKQTVKARTGYTVVTYKVYYQNGREISRVELHTSNYKMYQRTVQHNKPYVYGE
ncbi:MAG: VanW family protein [Clostridia bacterium]|nr:VanW family protein [Clostridia bacterium]